ncbi:MAG: DMT family transporter [Acidimicrobiales bacterium]
MTAAPAPTTNRTVGLALVVAGAVLFGTSGIAKGLGPDGLPAVFTGAWRTFIGGAALVAGAVASGRSLPRRPGVLAIGAVAVVVYQLCFFAALERLGVATTVVVSIGTGPIVAGLLDVVALSPSADGAERRRPTPGFLVGAAVAIAGVVLVSWPLGELDPLGALSAVIAGAAVPVYGAAAQALMAPSRAGAGGAGGARPLEAMAAIFGAAAVLVAPAVAWSAIDLAERASPPPLGPTVATVGWLGLVATGLAYWLWGRGLAGLSLSLVAVATMAEPAAATILSWVVLGDPVRLTTACGVVVVAVGVWLAARD